MTRTFCRDPDSSSTSFSSPGGLFRTGVYILYIILLYILYLYTYVHTAYARHSPYNILRSIYKNYPLHTLLFNLYIILCSYYTCRIVSCRYSYYTPYIYTDNYNNITQILVPLSRDISSIQLYYYITQNIRFAVFSSRNIIIRTFEYLNTYMRLCRSFYFPFSLKILFDFVRVRNTYYFDFKHVIVFCVHIIL